MTCKGCARWSPPDPDTGYDADDLCPECEEEWDLGDYADDDADMANDIEKELS